MNINKIAAFALGPISSAILAFATLPLLAWMFTPEDIGRITLLQVAISFSFSVFGLSLEQAFAREFYEHHNNAALLKTVFLPGLMLALGLIFIFAFSGFSISELLFEKTDIKISLLVYICVLSNFFTTYSSLILRMSENALAYSLVMLSAKLVFLLLILTVYVCGLPKEFYSLIGAHTVGITVAFVAGLWLTKREWRAAFLSPFLYDELLTYVRFSLPLIFGGLAYWGLTTFDRIAIRWWSDFEQLGIFSVALSFAGVAVLFQSIFTTMWTPFVYRWNAEGIDVKKLNQITEYVLAAIVFIYSLVGCFSWVVSYLLPDKYSMVPYIIPACIGVPLIYMLSETTVVGIHLMRKTFFSMLAPLIALSGNCIGNYYLVPSYGAAGAAASTSAAFFLFFLCRTEFSVFLWQSFPRKKIYFFVICCSLLSSLEAVFYPQIGRYIFLIWLAVLCVAVISFRPVLVIAFDEAIRRYQLLKKNPSASI